eukprot:3332136-Rhodomonas_salina.3
MALKCFSRVQVLEFEYNVCSYPGPKTVVRAVLKFAGLAFVPEWLVREVTCRGRRRNETHPLLFDFPIKIPVGILPVYPSIKNTRYAIVVRRYLGTP